MSYPKDIDEMTEFEMRGELTLRESRRAQGWCDYCCREPHEKECKFPKRHHDLRIKRTLTGPFTTGVQQ